MVELDVGTRTGKRRQEERRPKDDEKRAQSKIEGEEGKGEWTRGEERPKGRFIPCGFQ